MAEVGRIHIDDQALAALGPDMRDQVADADKVVRERGAGQPVADIETIARTQFESIGLNVTDTQIHDYAKSVADDRDFELNLT